MKYIYLFIFPLLLFTCYANESITIQITTSTDIFTREFPQKIHELKIIGFQHDIKNIKGLENCKELKKLVFLSVCGFSDFSFLEKLPNLEILVLGRCCCIMDFNFIKKLVNLKYIDIESVFIKKNYIDFTNNIDLEFIAINNIVEANENCKEIDNSFILNINNISENLKYLNLSLNGYLEFNNDFLKKIETIPTVLLNEAEYSKNEDYFDKHKNFKFIFPEKILPKEYQLRNIIEDIEFSFNLIEYIEW